MKPLRHAGLAEEVLLRLREEILEGRISQGTKLSENELATALGVSRAPVREGLIRLEQEGLVTSTPNRGASVVRLSQQDTKELATLRAAIEELAWSAACSKVDSDALSDMQKVVDEMRLQVEANAHDRLVRLDIEFHDRVFQVAGNERLYTAWKTIKWQTALYLLDRRSVSSDYHEIVVAEHQELLAVLAAGDPARAVSAINRHIAGAYLRILASYDEPEEVPAPFLPRTRLPGIRADSRRTRRV